METYTLTVVVKKRDDIEEPTDIVDAARIVQWLLTKDSLIEAEVIQPK